MKKLTIIILVLTLNSCSLFKKNGIEFKIENKSDFTIENVKFSTSEKIEIIEFNKIEPSESVSGFLSMKNNKIDGNYTLEFTRANKIKESKAYGYYSNGSAHYDWVEFEIKNDTINQKFSSQ